MASAAGPQLNKNLKDDDIDVISLVSSVPALHVHESLEDDRDDATSMDDHSSGVSPAAGHSMQPPAVSSAPAAAAAMLHDSADSEDIVIDLEDSDDNDAPKSHLPPGPEELPSAQPSSAAQQSKSLSEEPEVLQVRCCCTSHV
ncbi:g10997 [Coccomyxa viridis]|uniref:G10997 protein n=1 Tax=Coccomyxa viridis TaxID=1274662 RepID=A0ABP1G9F7_9CHLO